MRITLLLVAVLGVATGCGGVESEDIGVAAQAANGASAAIVTNHHFVSVSHGATLHVVEKYAAGAFHHGKRRALLMLPATLVTNNLWNADVPGASGFNALERAAQAGFVSYTLDYEGYGTSSKPSDGKTVTAERLADEAGDLVKWIRKRNHVSKVDLLGSSLGSTIAVMLGSTESPIHRKKIGRIVLTANVYEGVTPLAEQALFSAANKALFLSVPGGYIGTSPDMYGALLYASDPAAVGWAFQSFPGTYAVGPTLEGFDLPIFDAHKGRAPMLQFWGDGDLITPLSDAQAFQSAYGGDHSLVVLHGGAHVPHFEAVRDQFWSNTFAFLDSDDDDCDDDD